MELTPEHLALRLDPTTGVPIYVQLEEQLRLRILGGRANVGDHLPTVRALAVDLGINANTIARVYRDLQREGVLSLRRGVGTFVAKVPGERPVAREDFAAVAEAAEALARDAMRVGFSAGELSRMIRQLWKEIADDER